MILSDSIIIITLSIIGNLIISFMVIQLYLRKLKLKPLITMAKRFASSMGHASVKSRRSSKLIKVQKVAQKKLINGFIETLPFGEHIGKAIKKANLSDEDIFALMQKEDFVQGCKVIAKTLGGVTNLVKNALTKKEDKSQAVGMPYG